jgi:hypothetical protein
VSALEDQIRLAISDPATWLIRRAVGRGVPMDEPRRIQRQWTKGWRMPEGAVYVDRPSCWRNPFRIGDRFADRTWLHRRPSPLWAYDDRSPGVYRREWEKPWTQTIAVVQDRAHAVKLFRAWWAYEYGPDYEETRRWLAGRDLCCWCPLDQPCHADVLLEVANG